MLLETEFRRKRDHKIKRFEKEPRRRREGLNRRILLGEMEKKWSESEKYKWRGWNNKKTCFGIE